MKNHGPEAREARLQTILQGVADGLPLSAIAPILGVTKKTVGNIISEARTRGDVRFVTLKYKTSPGVRPSDPLTPEDLALARDAGLSITGVGQRLRCDPRRVARMAERLYLEGHPLFPEPWPVHTARLPPGTHAPRKRRKKKQIPKAQAATKPQRIIGDVPITVCPPGYAACGVAFLGAWPEKPLQPPSEAKPRTYEVPPHLNRPAKSTATAKYNGRGKGRDGSAGPLRSIADTVLGMIPKE